MNRARRITLAGAVAGALLTSLFMAAPMMAQCPRCDSVATAGATPCPPRTNHDANPGLWTSCTCEVIVRAYSTNRTITAQVTNDQYCWVTPCAFTGPARGSCPNVTNAVFKNGWVEQVSTLTFEVESYVGQTLVPLHPWHVAQKIDFATTDACGRAVTAWKFETSDIFVKYQIQNVLNGTAAVGEREIPICYMESGTLVLPYPLATPHESRLMARGKVTECQTNIPNGNTVETFAYCNVHVVAGSGPRCRPPCGLVE